MHVSLALDVVEREMKRACAIHPKFNSAHEGWAVMYEAVDELWDEVKRRHPGSAAMRTEAIHTAAMALRFLIDVCENPEEV
jgi:hypothetical protein